MLARWLPALPLSLAIVAAPVLIFQPEGLPRMRALTQELAAVQAENGVLERDIRHLKAEAQALRDNPRALERIARDQLGYVRPTEVVFQFARAR